nr:RNA polymerase beta' subunit [Chlorella variabilis]
MTLRKARLFDKLEIGVASPKQIRLWAERFLPTGELVGEVTSPETVNYKTLKPEPNGLFCEKIFGPTVDFTCACGKKSSKGLPKKATGSKSEFVRTTLSFGKARTFCSKCKVERTYSRIRRYRLGYIKLKQPVVHTLYASHRPSPISLCLNWSTRRLQAIMKCVEFSSLPPIFTTFRSKYESFNFFQLDDTKPKKLQKRIKVTIFETDLVFRPKASLERPTLRQVFVPKIENWSENFYLLPVRPSLIFKKTPLAVSLLKKKLNDGAGPKFLKNFGNDSSTSVEKTFDAFLDVKKGNKIETNFEDQDKENETSTISCLSVPNFEQLEGMEQKKDTINYHSKFKKRLNQNQPPRLFGDKKKQKIPFLVFNHGIQEIRLYGIGYDATWLKVEEFQTFLYYLWEKPFYYESSISYYAFVKAVKKHDQEIPRHEQFHPIQTSGFALQQILAHFDLSGLQNEISLQSAQGQIVLQRLRESLAYAKNKLEIKKVRLKIVRLQQILLKWKRQLELFRDFKRGKTQPAWMLLSNLPVLPPGLRPITSIGGVLVVSDVNTFYRKVLIRNNRISQGLPFGVFDTALDGSWHSYSFLLRQVQDAVDELFKKGGVESGRPLKSLLDGLKGKQGRFRQHLLGKRVDYSGRSVIVVGPELKLHECGLPKQMAIELFQPFIIQRLRKRGLAATTLAAKTLIAERKPIIWSILGEILRTHPVLLNRAPTLHRLGIQAFLPRLVEGKAILLHPLVCPAFNADFDGDQMAVHVPLSAKTRAEALTLLWARNHVLAPASGQPLLLPTQDMVLGFYYLTCSLEKGIKPLHSSIPSKKALDKKVFLSFYQKSWKNFGNQLTRSKPSTFYFSDSFQVKAAYDRGFLTLHTPIWIKWFGFVQSFQSETACRLKENLLETRIEPSGYIETLFLENCQLFNIQQNINKPYQSIEWKGTLCLKTTHFVRTTTGRVFMQSWVFDSTKSFSAGDNY